MALAHTFDPVTLDYPGRNPQFLDDSEEGIPRRYAGLAPHPRRPGVWLTWLIRQPHIQAAGPSPEEAMDAMAIKLKLEQRWVGRIRFEDQNVTPPEAAR